MRADLRDYRSPPPFYVAAEGVWAVAYHDKRYGRHDFSVRVDDKTKEAFVIQSDAGAFDGIK